MDASAMVDLLVGSTLGSVTQERVRGHALHVPAHFDAEVLSALGRLHRSGVLSARQAGARIERLATAPHQRHLLDGLVVGAWKMRHSLRLVDALYVELAEQLECPLLTTDRRLAAASPSAELIGEATD